MDKAIWKNLICTTCIVEFTPTYRTKIEPKYCSRECYLQHYPFFHKGLIEFLQNFKGQRFNRVVKKELREYFNNTCKHCGLGAQWNNKKITLQIDHIDGERTNNKIENLRLLCPNCHTQTVTFSIPKKWRKV